MRLLASLMIERKKRATWASVQSLLLRRLTMVQILHHASYGKLPLSPPFYSVICPKSNAVKFCWVQIDEANLVMLRIKELNVTVELLQAGHEGWRALSLVIKCLRAW